MRFTEGKSGVQFIHRMLAYIVVALILTLYFRSKKYSMSTTQQRGLNALLVVVFIQVGLGIFTLLYSVPLWLGVTHQAVAFFLLAAITFVVHRVSK